MTSKRFAKRECRKRLKGGFAGLECFCVTHSLKLPEIGEIILQKKRQNKTIRLKIKPPGIVSVSLPYNIDFKKAEKFVKEKSDWIKKSLEKVKAVKKEPEIISQDTNFKTRHHCLKFHPHKSKNAQCKLDKGIINFYYPEDKDIKDKFIQKCIRKSIDMALKKEAEEYLPGRLKFLSKQTGLNYTSLKIVSLKTYWGLCMDDNTIKLNAHLMRIPDDLADYVIFHELAHIKEKNHSKKFYDVLGKFIENPKSWNKKIKKYSPTRYLQKDS